MAPSKQYDEGGQLQLMEADRVEEEEECFETIDKLISQGINAGDVKKLQDAGIYTCNGLMMHTKKSLTGIKGLSEAKVDKICEAAEKLLTQGFMTRSDLLIKRKSVVRITTGSQALDELLGGGIETLCITDTFGEFRSGKAQLAHTLCVSTQLPLHMHGGNGKVAYFDTEGTFHPEHIVPIAERSGMDANAVLDNIIYARAYTYEHQYNLLLGLAAKMAEEPFRLLPKSVVRITTGSQALDELLGGGTETLCITEAFGEFWSGKTQLAHTLCVSTQTPEIIVSIVERFGMDANAFLENIVDSVITLFRAGFSGRAEHAECQGEEVDAEDGQQADAEEEAEQADPEAEQADPEDAHQAEEAHEVEQAHEDDDDDEDDGDAPQQQQQQQQHQQVLQNLIQKLQNNYEQQRNAREAVTEYRLLLDQGLGFQFAANLVREGLQTYRELRETATKIRLAITRLGAVPAPDPPGYDVFP